MSSKIILAGVVTAAIVNTASALSTTDKIITEKQIYGDTISNTMGGRLQIINTPECGIKSIVSEA